MTGPRTVLSNVLYSTVLYSTVKGLQYAIPDVDLLPIGTIGMVLQYIKYLQGRGISH